MVTTAQPAMADVIPIAAAPLIAELRRVGKTHMAYLCARYGTELVFDLFEQDIIVPVAVESLSVVEHSLLVGLPR